jgi:hypothetical protein
MWNRVRHADKGFLGGLNFVLKTLDATPGEELPDFSDDAGLFVASDYGGQHQGGAYLTYSFVFTTPKRWLLWEVERRRVRRIFGLDRRISFKNLSDQHKWDALPHFLGAASLLGGLTVTVLVHKSIRSVFFLGKGLDVRRPELEKFRAWKRPALERMLRVVYVFALLVAGLSREDHRILWITDQDDIVANDSRHQDLVDSAVELVSTLSPHRILGLESGTTAADNGSLEIEDLASIADLASGATGEVMTSLAQSGGRTSPALLSVVERGSAKSLRLIHWLSARGLPLKHVVIAVDPGPTQEVWSFRRMLLSTMERPMLVDLP